MILYCDSSSLVKRYLLEPRSDDVQKIILEADLVVISVIGYSEIYSSINRKYRNGDLNSKDYQKCCNDFERDWNSIALVKINDQLNAITKIILAKYPVRGFDALHVASAILLKKILKQEIHFLSYDNRQNDAAKSEKLNLNF